MQGGKKSHMTRRGRRFLALGVLMAAALAAVAVAQGGWLGIAGLGSGPSGYVGKGGKMVGQRSRLRRGLQSAVGHALPRSLLGEADTGCEEASQCRARRSRAFDEEGQLWPGAEVLAEQRL